MKKIVVICLLCLTFNMTAFASPSDDLKQAESTVQNIEQEKNALNDEINDLNEQLSDLLVNINVLEDDLNNKESEIAEVMEEYEKAKQLEETQYNLMKLRIKTVYEEDTNSLSSILGSDMNDFLNNVEYTMQIQKLDSNLLDEYKESQKNVIQTKEELENEKSELVELEESLSEQKAELETLINTKKEQESDFEKKLAEAKEYAKNLKETIRKEQEEQEKARKAKESKKSVNLSDKAESTTASITSDSDIVSYALQFVGNPYVSGGTSLTNGADCSGFTQSVFKHFGISIPRTSGEQALSGTTVSDEEKRPGDIVCYYGHVGIYIGNNQIVHASTEKTGIKIGNMYYRSIRCIKRYN